MTIEELHEYKCMDIKRPLFSGFFIGFDLVVALRLCRRGETYLVLNVGNLLSALVGREVQ